MGRAAVLSNGQIFVGLDENGLVHDFYYPYVGLDNLANARSSQHKIGVWVNGDFRWTEDGSWQIDVSMENDALICNVRMHSNELGITLELQNFVDIEYNAFFRHIKVINELDSQRDIRVFMHQVFQISRAGRADTAMYVPDDHYILDYKGRCCLAIGGKLGKSASFDQYAVGNYAIEGKAGTFKDAEDGELSGNLVEHGGVDSVIRFRSITEGHESFKFDYWIIAADSQTDAQEIHGYFKSHPMTKRLDGARTSWRNWLEPAQEKLAQMPVAERELAQKSLLIIKAHCDDRGSVLASGDSSIFNFGRDYYCYCWPRDAAYALWPLIRLGLYDEAKRFFEFARDTMHRDGYLSHKYQPDRAIGSTWHPLLHGRNKELAIQEDETAIVIFMIGEFYRRSEDKAFLESFYNSFIVPCANFMSHYVDDTGLPHASYDLWEQKFLTSTYTASTVIAGLETAAQLAQVVDRTENSLRWEEAARKMRENFSVFFHPKGYYRKGFLQQDNGELVFDDTLDISSFYGPYMFARLGVEDPQVQSTLQHVEQRLLDSSPIGGVVRFEYDDYFLAKRKYKGNPWVVCSLWLAQYYKADGQIDKAAKLMHWAFQRTQPSDVLSEQFDPENGNAIGVTPLVWSHAEFVNTALDFYDID